MRILSFILVCFLSFSLFAQKKKLRRQTFEDLKLSHSYIIVKYKEINQQAPSSISLLTLNQGTATRSKKGSILDGVVKIPIGIADDPIKVCNDFLNDPNVIYAEPIIIDRPLAITSDPLVENQYYLENIKAFEAWEVTKGDDDIAIGIIDTGLDLDHEDLREKLWVNVKDTIDGIDNDENGYIDDYIGYDFSENDNVPEADLDTHGAVVAGVAGAEPDNGIGIAGIGYNSKIAALKGFNSTTGFSSGLFDAILYAANNGIEIINLSWGSIREPLQSEQDIINYAVLEKNVVVVAAAGNDGEKLTANEKFYPASYDNVLSIGGSTVDDTKWSRSSYNHSVDLIAPASGVFSTAGNNGYISDFGTSFAAPMVAATAALVKDQFPNLTAQQLMERVRVTADDIYDVGNNNLFAGNLGRGRLNAFRAVSDENLKSLRVENVTIRSSYEPIFYGDTLSISFDLMNYLDNLNDPSVYISSPDNEFLVDQKSIFPGLLATLQKSTNEIKIILSENLIPESNIGIRLDFQDGNYNDFQFIDIKTAPDYATFGNETLELPIAGDGRLGIIDYSENIGSGFLRQSETLLNHTGILFTSSEEIVSDNIISDYTNLDRENDFEVQKFYKLQHHPFAANFGYSEFVDPRNNLIIEQSNIASIKDEFIIIRYRIINNGSEKIDNLTFGVFADWELGVGNKNYTQYHIEKDYFLTLNSDSTRYAATKIIGSGTSRYNALDLADFNGNTRDLDSTFSDQEKHDFLINQITKSAGLQGDGNNVATIHGLTTDALDSADFTYISLIYALGDTQELLENNISLAKNYLQNFNLNPQVLETVISCDGGSTTIHPDGNLFAFYEDPLGLQFISKGESYSPVSISSDTAFYVRNLDAGYPSEIFEVRIKLFDDLANFSIQTDTLYLDHPTTNIVSFKDESIDPISWQWDFGEGTQSTLQNPSISFDEPGTYTISLTIENESGCIDTVSKELVVANRPNPLVFETITSCPNEIITLTESGASKLFLFANESQENPIASGNELELGPFKTDTAFFVSAKVNGFLTKRSVLEIDIFEVPSTIFIRPDTISATHQLVAKAEVDSSSIVNWMVNGESFGSEKEIFIPASLDNLSIQLEVLAQSGCSITTEKQYEVSTSPKPEVTDYTGCLESKIILRPLNGSYFGFYADENLDSLIKKGQQLLVNQNSEVFVVGLDDVLPGQVAKSIISFEDFEVEINFTSTIINDVNRVQLTSSSSHPITDYNWFIDGELAGTSSAPTFFLNNLINEIVLLSESESGCISADTLLLDFTPPPVLGIVDDPLFTIYPNPSTGKVQLTTEEKLYKIFIHDMAGRVLKEIESPELTIDLSELNPGVYFIELIGNSQSEKMKLIIQ